jgi:lipid II:glycine glycyltransferase (peptidoglycan interpeptide bridge formation enzyme)
MENVGFFEGNDQEWDEFVKSSPMGEIYSSSTWRRVVEKSFGHIRARHLIVKDGNSGHIVSALPLYEVKSWLLGKRLVSVPFGTLCDPLAKSHEDFTALVEHALGLKKKLGYKRIELKIFKTADQLDKEKLTLLTTHKHHYLLLDKEFSALTKGFKRTVRQAVRKAEDSGLRVEDSAGEEGLRAFYRLYMMTRKRNSVPTQPYKFFRNLWEEFQKSGAISLRLVKKDEKVICGGIILSFKGRTSLEFLASDSDFLQLRPNHLLAWEAIKRAQESGSEVFDFGRTAPDDEGLMRFKTYWGTNIVDLMVATEIGGATGENLNRQGYAWKTATTLSRKLPDTLYRSFSSYCYRHLG